MNIICIGGAGYIGSIVTDELIEAGHKVVVMDELVKGRGHRKAVNEKARFECGDYGKSGSKEYDEKSLSCWCYPRRIFL